MSTSPVKVQREGKKMTQAKALRAEKSAATHHRQAIIACSDPEMVQTIIGVLRES